MKEIADVERSAPLSGTEGKTSSKAATTEPSLASGLFALLGKMGPAWLVLGAGVAASFFPGHVADFLGAQDPWQAPWRFLRLCLVVALPTLALPRLCSLLGWWLNRGDRRLLAAPRETKARAGRLSLWLLRPAQGLGLLMLVASKVLVLLQLYTGSGLTAADLPANGQALPRLRLIVWGTGVVTSLLLTTLWTLDDLRLRLYNAKAREVRRVGRYLGLILPVIFGVYGIYNVFANNAHLPALKMTIHMTVVLYPVFVVLSVWHDHLMQVRGEALLFRLGPRPDGLNLAAETFAPAGRDDSAANGNSSPPAREACDEP